MTAQSFARKINQYARESTPFFFIVNFEKTDFRVMPLEDTLKAGIYYDIKGKKNTETKPGKKTLRLRLSPMSPEQYVDAFEQVQANLRAGNSYLLNLTFPTPITASLSMQEIFSLAQAPYKLYLEGQCVVFSPECFVRIEADRIYTYPMKGTIDADLPDAERLILQDKKEKAEHVTIVDLLRNDLSRVAEQVTVSKFRFVEQIKTNRKNLLQVSSEISGKLCPDWRFQLGEILLSLLPAGSVSGAPKAKTLEIIREAEQVHRGWYTGVFGIFDGKVLDTAVAIRFIEKNAEGGLQFRSGGGITVYSEAHREYNEMLDKVYVPTF